MPATSKSPGACGPFPRVAPQKLVLPWLIAFTTLAQHNGAPRDFAGAPFDFIAGKGENNRRALERALMQELTQGSTQEPAGEYRSEGEGDKSADASARTSPVLTWLSLEHGTRIVTLDGKTSASEAFLSVPAPVADAAILTVPGTAVAFTTADCLPLVCASSEKQVVAAIHAGWRSLAGGIIERALEQLADSHGVRPETLMVWIGPAIAGEDYEVGGEVRDALLVRPAITEKHFTSCGDEHFLADLPGAAMAILTSFGVPASSIERYPHSTKSSPLYHSVRRDGTQAGRMATVAALRPTPCAATSA
ncbi:MAG: polyphenol oxidase family protein [Coriobacteriales bacterium]|nr:polyphenol oxidase family protein [Coriobacteriales bacterium]